MGKRMGAVAANHFSFTVSDAEQTAQYLEYTFGLQRLSIGPREPQAIREVTAVPDADIVIAYLQAVNVRIELVQYLAPSQRETFRPRPCDLGFAHMAFDVQQFDAVIARAAEYGAHPIGGVAIIDRGPNTGCRVTYLRNEDGITIELVEKQAVLATDRAKS